MGQRRKEPMKTIATAALGAILLLQGCDNPPPGCGEAKALEAMKGGIQREVSKALQSEYDDPLGLYNPDDTRKVLQLAGEYASAISVTADQVTSDGYDKGAKKHTCRAKLTVSLPTSLRLTGDKAFTVQSLTGKDGEFVVLLDGAQHIVQAARRDFPEYFIGKGVQLRIRQSGIQQPAASAENGCVETRMRWARIEQERQLHKLTEAAAIKGEPFRGLSPVQEEEWEQRTRADLQRICGT